MKYSFDDNETQYDYKRVWINFFQFWGLVIFFSFAMTTSELAETNFWNAFTTICIIITFASSIIVSLHLSKKKPKNTT